MQKAEESGAEKDISSSNKLYGITSITADKTHTYIKEKMRENEEDEEKKDEIQQETKTETDTHLPPKYDEKIEKIEIIEKTEALPYMSSSLPGTISISVYANTVTEIPFLISSATSSPNLILGGEMGSSGSSTFWNPSSPSFGSTSRYSTYIHVLLRCVLTIIILNTVRCAKY